jgi:hypothetical protein
MTEERELERLRVAEQIREALRTIIEEQQATRGDIAAMKPQIDRIEAQTILTNGRVTRLELWRARSAGMMTAIGAAVTGIGWLLGWLFGFLKGN